MDDRASDLARNKCRLITGPTLKDEGNTTSLETIMKHLFVIEVRTPDGSTDVEVKAALKKGLERILFDWDEIYFTDDLKLALEDDGSINPGPIWTCAFCGIKQPPVNDISENEQWEEVFRLDKDTIRDDHHACPKCADEHLDYEEELCKYLDASPFIKKGHEKFLLFQPRQKENKQ